MTTFDHGRHTVKIGEFKLTAFGIAVDSFNHKVIATGDNSSEVWIVNESTNKVIRTVTTGGQPETLTIDTTNHCAYVFLYGTTQVAIVSGV